MKGFYMRKAILGLAPLLLALGSAAAAQTPAWQLSEVSGDVRIVENGRSRAAVRGALLSTGSTIATAARARAVLVRGQEYVVVSPGSRLRIPEPSAERGGIIQMLADWGTALFRIERRATPHFGVQTPYLAAVVKGTVFTVTVGEAGASVQVTEGAVEVSTLDAGAAEIIRPGMVVSVSGSDLLQLNVEGETNRTVRSNGTPLPGVVAIPSPQPATPEGAPTSAIEIIAPVTEEPVSLAAATGGLIEGTLGFDLALANVADAGRFTARPGRPVAEAPPSGGGEAPSPAAGGDDTGAPPTGGNGEGTGDSDVSTPPPPADDGNNGHGNDPGGQDSSNPGQGGGNSGPGTSDPGGSDTGEPGAGGPGSEEPGTEEPGAGNPGTENPPAGDPDAGDPGTEDPGAGNPGTEDPGTDDPGTGDPGAGDPGTEDPGTEDPGSGDPGVGGPGEDPGIEICLPGDLVCLGLGGGGDDGPPGGDGGIDLCLPGDLLCLGIGGGGADDDDDDDDQGGRCLLGLLCRRD